MWRVVILVCLALAVSADQQTPSQICHGCKLTVSHLTEIASDPQKIGVFKTHLSAACQHLPAAFQEECQTLTNHLENVFETFKPILADPSGICSQISLCGSETPSKLSRFLVLYLKKKVLKVANPNYEEKTIRDECESLVKEFQEIASDPKFQESLKFYPKKAVCDVSTNKIEIAKCEANFESMAAPFFKEFQKLLGNPTKVCADLGLITKPQMILNGLPNNKERKIASLTPNPDWNKFTFFLHRLHTKDGMSSSCIMCKYSFNLILSLLQDDKSILGNIKDGLRDQICPKFPKQLWQPGCNDFLNEYGVPVLLLTVQELSGQMICDDLKICSEHETEQMLKNGMKEAWKSELVCDACKTVAGYLDMEIKTPSFQKGLTQKAKQICDKLPGDFASTCDGLMDQYIPKIIQYLEVDLAPNQICPQLNLCKA